MIIFNPGRKAIHYGLPAGEWKGQKVKRQKEKDRTQVNRKPG